MGVARTACGVHTDEEILTCPFTSAFRANRECHVSQAPGAVIPGAPRESRASCRYATDGFPRAARGTSQGSGLLPRRARGTGTAATPGAGRERSLLTGLESPLR